jgi:beta-glucanase (GH16 family)
MNPVPFGGQPFPGCHRRERAYHRHQFAPSFGFHLENRKPGFVAEKRHALDQAADRFNCSGSAFIDFFDRAQLIGREKKLQTNFDELVRRNYFSSAGSKPRSVGCLARDGELKMGISFVSASGSVSLMPMQRIALIFAMIAPVLAADPWKLAWSDEFDADGLPDAQKWTNEVGFIRNAEAQYYTVGRKENARVENGKLVIEARKEKFPNARGTAGITEGRRREFAEISSASLNTRGLREQRYGRIEVKAKLPKGRGVWPAIWMLGIDRERAGWPRCGEIDIMEYVGFEPNTIHANIHTGKYNHVKKTGKGSRIQVEKPYDSFHVYAIEWSPERIDFFADENKYFTYEKEPNAGSDAWPFDKPFYLILNLAIGGAWGGQKGIDDSIFPARYEIDYVRIYEPSNK